MSSAAGKVFLFLLVSLGAFLWVGYSVTQLTGGEKQIAGAVEITPEGGETIFWGKGRCFTCHSVGGRGSAVRGPNQGQFGAKFPTPIGARAVERARERSEKTGREYTATDYLVESLAVPGAYVVEGYKNEMAIVYAPPISLSLKEIKAVLTYLQSLGGEIDLEAINNPGDVGGEYFARIAAATEAGGGDPGNGEIVFEDYCSECHQIEGEGGEVGPDLTLAGINKLGFLSDSILHPAKEFTEGFETYIVVNKEGRRFIGIRTRETAEEIDITRATGEVVTIAQADIAEITQDENTSIMPEDMTEALTVKDFQDVLAFMLMLKGEDTGAE